MTRALSNRIERLEGIQGPGHRHQPLVHIQRGDDLGERLAEAKLECMAHGCAFGLLAIPAPVNPGDWTLFVDAELALLAERKREQYDL